MGTLSDNMPVIVGVGQLVDRDASINDHIQPLEMLTRVARLAEQDSGKDSLLTRLDTIALVGVAGWHPQNPVNLLANSISAAPRRQMTTGIGGQVGISLLNEVASRIVEGKSEVSLVAGCNNLRVLRKAIAANIHLDWTKGGAGEAEVFEGDQPGSNDLEGQYGLTQPPEIYPLFENALRARLGLSLPDHRKRMGELFTGFTEVASVNPYAWFPVRRSAKELITETPENRMIAYPYTKYLNAILDTEQAAAVIVCSAAKAQSLGIPREKWVFWQGGARSQERAWWVSERPRFDECPSMKDTLYGALQNSGVTLDQIDYFDFYSCFPVAVEMACEMLGLEVTDPRGFTVTGGLPYAGGPASAYTLHSVSAMTHLLRNREGGKGMVTGNGWYLTKHSACILSADPPSLVTGKTALTDPLPSREMEKEPVQVDQNAVGEGTIEAYTVLYNREGLPCRGIVLGKTVAGTRFMANTAENTSDLERFVEEEQVGRKGDITDSEKGKRFTL